VAPPESAAEARQRKRLKRVLTGLVWAMPVIFGLLMAWLMLFYHRTPLPPEERFKREAVHFAKVVTAVQQCGYLPEAIDAPGRFYETRAEFPRVLAPHLAAEARRVAKEGAAARCPGLLAELRLMNRIEDRTGHYWRSDYQTTLDAILAPPGGAAPVQ